MSDYMRYVLMVWTPQGLDWLWILLIVLLIFGRRLPEVAKSLGKSLTEFKKGIHEAEQTKDEFEKDVRKIGDDIAKETKNTSGMDGSK
jgi:sec-independent protein translocase protein TatA